jgi:hypothetical protein
MDHVVAQLVEALRFKRRFDFSLTYVIFPAALWPWGDSASNINEYQKYFLGGGVNAAGA